MAQNPPPVQVVFTATDKTREAITSATQGINSLKESAGSLQGVIGGAVAALAGLAAVRAFNSFVEGAAAMDDLSEKTGASVEKLSALAGVAKISGVSLDVVEGSLIRLAKGLAGADEESKGAGNALAALGLKAEELKGLDTADALKIVAERLNEYKDGAGKTALAIDLLGKSGAQALPYLKDLGETSQLVGKLTAEQAAQAEQLEKNLVRLSASTSGAWKEFSAAVLPTVDAFVKALLEAQNGTGGLRDQVRKLGADGTIRDWAETAAIGVAYLIDAFKNVVNLTKLAGSSAASAFVEAEIAVTQLQKRLGDGRQGRFYDQQIEGLKKLRAESRAGLGEAFEQFLNAPQFSQQIREKFAALRSAVPSEDPAKKSLDYTSNVAKAGGAAKDELKAIETYVNGVREQVVGVTDGEFEKMRQKAIDTFSQVDFSKLSAPDRAKFSEFFAQVTEDIDTLEERARNQTWAKTLAEGLQIAAAAAEKADEALSAFNEVQSRQAQDLQFEIDMVGKLSSERQKLAAIRRIDLDAQRAAAAVPENASNRDERLADIAKTAENAKVQVGSLYDDLRTKGRDIYTGLATVSREYVDRISNDAANIQQVFNTAFKSLEDTLVNFVTTGKLNFKGLVDSIISEIARIQIRKNITGPLAEAVGGGGGAGGLFGDLFKNIFGSSGNTGISGSAGFTSDFNFLGFANGGRPPVGVPSIVGEQGPEMFIPDSAGTIIPNGAMGGITVVQNISIDSRSDQASILQAMAAAKEQAKTEILDSMNRGGAFRRG